MGAEDFLRKHFRAYYSGNKVNPVPEIASREFGIGELGKKISSRHLAFRSAPEMDSFLRERTPFYISCSSAYYGFPANRPMEKKNLLGADLIYEFDADDIKTDCKLSHDSWKCPACNASGKGAPEKCSGCGAGVKVDEWVCNECISETKRQTKKLLAVLENEFWFSEGISTNFSGSKGFHVHVRIPLVRGLSRAARLELLDYITASNLSLESLGFFPEAKNVFRCPKKAHAKAWAKKLVLGIERMLNESSATELASKVSRSGYNFTKPMAEKILKENHRIISSMDKGFLPNIQGVKSEKFWAGLLAHVIEEERLDVDRQTSIDINKIVRVPGSIHGSTGLAAKEFERESLSSFDALKECVIFGSEEVRLRNVSSPKFYLNEERFGPFDNEDIALPLYAGIYLVARGSAFPIEAL